MVKRFLVLLLLSVAVQSLLARDVGGDGAVIPDMQELAREGYASSDYDRNEARRNLDSGLIDNGRYGNLRYSNNGYYDNYRPVTRRSTESDYTAGRASSLDSGYNYRGGDRNPIIVKPTQAYYARNGQTIYYGYTNVRTRSYDDTTALYAFGHPSRFYQDHLPLQPEGESLEHVALAINRPVYRDEEEIATYRPRHHVIYPNAVSAVAVVSRPAPAAATTAVASASATASAPKTVVAAAGNPTAASSTPATPASPVTDAAAKIGTIALPAIGEGPR